jgi:hypothetical protein
MASAFACLLLAPRRHKGDSTDMMVEAPAPAAVKQTVSNDRKYHPHPRTKYCVQNNRLLASRVSKVLSLFRVHTTRAPNHLASRVT